MALSIFFPQDKVTKRHYDDIKKIHTTLQWGVCRDNTDEGERGVQENRQYFFKCEEK